MYNIYYELKLVRVYILLKVANANFCSFVCLFYFYFLFLFLFFLKKLK